MVIAKIKVDGVSAVATELSQIPKGIQGATIEVTYDGAWKNLNKTAVFSGSVVKDVVNAGAVIPVPTETVAKSGHRLRVGFYGVDGENKVIIPTLWVDLGAIQSAADPSGDASTNPSLPVWAQLQAEVEALKEAGGGADTGATAEQAAQITQNKEDIEKLSREKLDASKLPEAVKGIVNELGIPEIVCPVSGDVITVSDSLNQKLRGLNLFGKTTQNGTPTPESPVELESVGDDGSVAVTVCGKNLLPNNLASQNIKGVQFTVDSDGKITVNGTATDYADGYFYGGDFDNGEYLFIPKGSRFVAESSTDCFYIGRERTKGAIIGTNPMNAALATQDCYFYGVCCRVPKGATVDNLSTYAGIYTADTDTTYEPYASGGSVTAQTPNGLPGIPVTSGGNYTDENGQQWVCDEVNFARGKYVQRVCRLTNPTKVISGYHNDVGTLVGRLVDDSLYNSDELKVGTVMCNSLPATSGRTQWFANQSCLSTGKNNVLLTVKDITTIDELRAWLASHPLDILYALASPIETDLPAEEIAQYSALHTNYPNTTIYNDEVAGMAVKYVADTKLYIDNKFTELQNAILSAGANI